MFLRTLVMSLTVVGGLGAMMCNGRTPLPGLTCGLGVSMPSLPTDAQTYVMMAAAGDQFEIQSSQIAQIKAVSNDVRNLAQTLINDHTAMSSKLSAAATSVGLAAPVPMLSANQQQMINDLQAAPSWNFDQLFLRDQIMAHEMALALHSNYASAGDNSVLRAVASGAVPIIQSHISSATSLMIASGGMMASSFCPANYWCNSDFDAFGASFSVCCPSDVPLLPPVSISASLYSAPLYNPAPIYNSAPIYNNGLSATYALPASGGSGSGSLVCVGGRCAVYGTASVAGSLGAPTVVNAGLGF